MCVPAGRGSRCTVRCSGQSQVALFQQLQQLLFSWSSQCYQTTNESVRCSVTKHSTHNWQKHSWRAQYVRLTSDVHLAGDVHSSCQVPHLDAAITVATEKVPPRTRANAARALTLMYHECSDGGAIHWTHLTHPEKGWSFRQWSKFQWHNLLFSYLFPLDESLTYSLSVSGTTLWMNTCWSSLSPYGPGTQWSCDLSLTLNNCESRLKIPQNVCGKLMAGGFF